MLTCRAAAQPTPCRRDRGEVGKPDAVDRRRRRREELTHPVSALPSWCRARTCGTHLDRIVAPRVPFRNILLIGLRSGGAPLGHTHHKRHAYCSLTSS